MSATLTLADMEALVKEKVPLGLSTAYVDNRIFEAYRWIEEQGPFKWDVVNQDLTVRQNTFFVAVADMPGGAGLPTAPPMNIGAPVIMYGSSNINFGGGKFPIPYVAPDKLGLHQLYHVPPVAGQFSCFSIITDGSTVGFGPTGVSWPGNKPYIQFAPSSANPTVTTGDLKYHCIYHQQSPMNLKIFLGAIGTPSTTYFPTPDAFDDMIVNLAVAFVKENYTLAGSQGAIEKAQAQIAQVLDRYRSTTQYMEGLIAQASEAQQSQAQKAE